VRIDFIFDTVCPWCFIGKRRLERALALRPDVRAVIRWRPFLLYPEIPPQGLDRKTHLERKFGSIYRIQRIHAAAAVAGEEEGIAFAFEAITRTPSSINSHRLIHWSAQSGRENQVVDRIFQAYFLDGQDIGDISVLSSLAADCGLSGSEAAHYLSSSAGAAAVEAENLRVHRLGVSGVPFHIFAERFAVAGAQEPEILARLIDIARETEFLAVSQ
jgi:predicted DsbA family dithiol-disulfide isomerase